MKESEQVGMREQRMITEAPLSPIERAIVAALVSAIVKELRAESATARQSVA